MGFDSPRSEAEEAVGESESANPHAVHPEEEILGKARAMTDSGGVVTAAHGLGRCRPRVEAARNCWRPSIPAVPGRQTRPHDEARIQLDDAVVRKARCSGGGSSRGLASSARSDAMGERERCGTEWWPGKD